MRDMNHEQAFAYAAMIKRLEEWGSSNAGRDTLIKEAHDLGLSNTQIAKRMRISRTTVIQALGTDDESED